jgi:hypothetical protein
MSKHYETNLVHPYSLRAFQQYQKHNKRHHGLWDVNMTNKTDIQTTFLQRWITPFGLTSRLDMCHKTTSPIATLWWLCQVVRNILGFSYLVKSLFEHWSWEHTRCGFSRQAHMFSLSELVIHLPPFWECKKMIAMGEIYTTYLICIKAASNVFILICISAL